MPAQFIPVDTLSEFERAYFEQLGLLSTEGIDRRRADRAFERALQVRDFEIELYWKRATYFWGFQAAFLGTIAVLTNGGIKDSLAPLIACVVSLTAFFVSWRWSDMSRGAKFWQDNWERHVDILEPYFTGNLYRLYPAKKRLVRPPSVSSMNSSVVHVMMCLWGICYVVFGTIAFKTDPIASFLAVHSLPAGLPTSLILGVMLEALSIKVLDVLFTQSSSDQEDATFANPVVELPSGAALHIRKKLS